MKIIAVIPARYEASRFPAKLMQDLCGKPVILRTYEAVVATHLFDTVYVATDSKKIYEVIEKVGGHVVMSQKEHDCGSDRIAEAVAHLDVDIVVNVQGDEPFTDKESLAKVLQVFENDTKQEIDLASLMVRIKDSSEINDSNTVKVVVDHKNFALYFSRSPIPYARNKEIEPVYYKHKGVYAFRKSAIMDFQRLPMRTLEATEKIEAIRYLEYGKKLKMVETKVLGIEIDTPEDLKKAQALWK